jgi:PncC family amidohydrolase
VYQPTVPGAREKKIAVAEACTAGLIGSMLCSVPGASRYLLGGIIAYTGDTKTRLLGVPESLLRSQGSVSHATALEMARRAWQVVGADVAVSTTGVAGPTTGHGHADFPVGRFYIGLAARDGYEETRELQVDGDRNTNRRLAAEAALDMARAYLQRKP